jgi:hypothetical protein
MELFYLAAILLGLAVGIKYSGLVYAVALAPLAIWAVVSRRQGVAASLQRLTLFGCVFAAVALPWLIKNWLLLRAPLYPFLAQPTLPSWLVPLFGSRTLSPSLHPEIVPYIWDLRAPFNLRDAFIAPGRLTIELEGAYYFLNPAFLILPLWVFFVRNRILSWLLIPAILYLFIVLAILPSPNLRYLIPALAPLTIVVAHVAVRASERFLSRRAGPLLLVSLACLALTHSASTAATYLRRSTAVEHLLGLSSADRYIRSHIGGSYVETYKFVNTSLPAESRILMLFDARGFYFRRQVVQDNDGIGWPLLASVLSPGSCLEPLRITHVMLGIGSLRYYLHAGLDPERVRWQAFLEFADRCLQPVHEEPGIVLFEVKPRALPPLQSQDADEEAGEDDEEAQHQGGG